jgi:hypothetical protein
LSRFFVFYVERTVASQTSEGKEQLDAEQFSVLLIALSSERDTIGPMAWNDLEV